MEMVLSGKVALEPFVQTKPMSTIAQTFEEIHTTGSPEKRVVLVPDF
jgi:6-hydroxycyclohex-1-ene-1-carbonyl-CoA dehydrogenase